jgi:hypothetical protein
VVTLIKDILNAAFFVVVATVTILTYVRAKRTLLQPLKTEIFKQQISLFSDLLKIVVGKGEIELRAAIGLEKMFLANLHYQWDIYARLQFGLIRNEATRPYNRTDCPISLMTVTKDEMPEDTALDEVVNIQVAPARWAEHRVNEVRAPAEFTAMKSRLTEFIESPLVPQELADLINAYMELMDANVKELRQALNEYIQTLSTLAPSLEHCKQLNDTAARNIFARRVRDLKPAADAIVKYVRTYFAVEQLMTIE